MASRTRVLIVDASANSLDSLVEAWGCDVQQARSGADALRTLARPPHPDIVIVDVALPDLDGCDLIRQMRTAMPGLLIVANTGHDDLRSAAWAAGADAFLLKPDLQSLQDLLDRLTAAPRFRKRRAGGSPQ